MLDLEASHEAYERCRQSVGSGVSSGLRSAMRPHPLFVERGAGSRVWDVSGNEFVDYVMGWGPLILGHSHPSVVSAVTEVVAKMQMVGMGHRLEYEAAESVLDAVPHAERLLWSNTGTEAVQIALRLARAATGRNTVVKFVHSYHGWHDSVFASVRDHDGGEDATLNSLGQNPNSVTDLILLPFNDVDAVRAVLGESKERGIAAVLIDPIMSNAGVIAPDPGFLETLRGLCDAHDVVLVFDEVIAGFRIALGGVAERYGVRPDLSVFGKAIAGGFSQSAVVGRASIIDLVGKGAVHAGTYNGNPVSLAAVQATLTVLREDGQFDRLDAMAARMEAGIRGVFDESDLPITTRRIGSLVQIVEQAPPGTEKLWPGLTGELLRNGVVALPSGKMFVSTAHTADDIERTVAALQMATRSLDVHVG